MITFALFFKGFIYFKGGLFLYDLVELQTLTGPFSPYECLNLCYGKEACVQTVTGSLLLCAMND